MPHLTATHIQLFSLHAQDQQASVLESTGYQIL